MFSRSVPAILAIISFGGALHGQSLDRRAIVRGGNRGGSGKCTIEVVVDGAAQVEIRGDRATLRNVNGQQPQWRRFECDSVMPADPANFRFAGVDGRGRQTLIRDPRGGSPAVIQIEDPDNGTEGYTFDITWGGGRDGGFQSNNGNGYPDGGRGRRFTAEQAVQSCQDAIRNQARDRFRSNDITFGRTAIDDRPGRNDWVVGSVEARTPYGRPQVARFSCSVNFENGRVRSAQFDEGGPDNGRRDNGGYPGNISGVAVQNCQRAVEDRMRNDGFSRPVFGSVRADDQPGRDDRVVGDVRANGRYGPESFRFSCSVNLRNGDVRSVDVTTRR